MTTTEHTTNADEYNGWVNRETWAAHLHLSNNYDLYTISRRIVTEEDADQTEWQAEHNMIGSPIGGFAARRFEDWITEAVTELLHADTMTPDAWRSTEWIRMMMADVGSFDRVDWHAVAAAFRED